MIRPPRTVKQPHQQVRQRPQEEPGIPSLVQTPVRAGEPEEPILGVNMISEARRQRRPGRPPHARHRRTRTSRRSRWISPDMSPSWSSTCPLPLASQKIHGGRGQVASRCTSSPEGGRCSRCSIASCLTPSPAGSFPCCRPGAFEVVGFPPTMTGRIPARPGRCSVKLASRVCALRRLGGVTLFPLVHPVVPRRPPVGECPAATRHRALASYVLLAPATCELVGRLTLAG
jgi:hypothetical protein